MRAPLTIDLRGDTSCLKFKRAVPPQDDSAILLCRQKRSLEQRLCSKKDRKRSDLPCRPRMVLAALQRRLACLYEGPPPSSVSTTGSTPSPPTDWPLSAENPDDPPRD